MVVREVDIQGFHSISDLIPDENLVSIFMKEDEDDLKEEFFDVVKFQMKN